jgi:hypothetical protein
MYPKQEQSENIVNRAPFWAVLERTAALAELEDRVKLPELVEIGGDVSPVGPGDTRTVESDSQRPSEVFAHIRDLLGDVEGGDEIERLSLPDSGVQVPTQHETADTQGGAGELSHQSAESGVALDESSSEIQEVAAQPSGEVSFEVFPAVPLADDSQIAVGVSEGISDGESGAPDDGAGPMYEFGSHATVIPGTEEFMNSLARKNRAFEHTGEIDTDLDRAADKLGWSRTDDDLVVKRKIFKKKKK